MVKLKNDKIQFGTQIRHFAYCTPVGFVQPSAHCRRWRSPGATSLDIPRTAFRLFLGSFPHLIAKDIWIMRRVKNSSDNSDTAAQTAHTSAGPLPPLPARVYFLRICASDGAHVFMHSGRTGAACNSSPACRSKEHSRCSDVSPRENKQNRGHFIQDGGTVKIRAGTPPPHPHHLPSQTGTPLCGSQFDLS